MIRRLVLLAGALVLLPLFLLGGWLMLRPSSTNADPPRRTGPRDEFASDRDPPASHTKPLPFDSARAMKYLETLCAIGPRISGSEGMAKQRELLQKHFEKHGAKVEYQTFTGRQKRRPSVEMANVIVRWFPERTERVILCAHYDTRPIADQEPNRKKWFDPFVSANDGTSGVAWLMELAHHMKGLSTGVGVDFVLFDGEEYVFDPSPDGDRYFLGSEHFAAEYKKQRKVRYQSAVLLDLFAGKDARIPVEPRSYWAAAPLVKTLWKIADEQKCSAFVNRQGPEVLDDHIALNRAGIPAVDLIDFDYKHWHRLSDVPANCSADSMEQVARVLTVWLQQLK